MSSLCTLIVKSITPSYGGTKICLVRHFHYLPLLFIPLHLYIISSPQKTFLFLLPISSSSYLHIPLCPTSSRTLSNFTLVFQIYCWLQNIIYDEMDWFFKIYPRHGLIANYQISLKISTGVKILHNFSMPTMIFPIITLFIDANVKHS